MGSCPSGVGEVSELKGLLEIFQCGLRVVKMIVIVSEDEQKNEQHQTDHDHHFSFFS